MSITKKDTKPRTGTQKPEWKFSLSSISDTFRNETFLFTSGAVLTIVAIFILVAYISFLFNGGTDQSAVLNGASEIENSTGVLGARASEFIVNGWFGFSSVLIPVFLAVCGLNMMRITHFKLFRWFISCAFLMVWTSVFLQFILSPIMQNSFIIPGGCHGMNATNFLRGYIGVPGLLLLLILTMLLYCIYLTRRTIEVIRGGAARMKHSMLRREKVSEPAGQNMRARWAAQNPTWPKMQKNCLSLYLCLWTPIHTSTMNGCFRYARSRVSVSFPCVSLKH